MSVARFCESTAARPQRVLVAPAPSPTLLVPLEVCFDLLPRRVRCSQLRAMLVQRARVLEQARRMTSPQ